MDNEKRKLYNKEYYSINKKSLLSKACCDVVCEFCGRTVKYCNLKNHTLTKLCSTNRIDHESLSQKVEELTLKIMEIENKNNFKQNKKKI